MLQVVVKVNKKVSMPFPNTQYSSYALSISSPHTPTSIVHKTLHKALYLKPQLRTTAILARLST